VEEALLIDFDNGMDLQDESDPQEAAAKTVRMVLDSKTHT